MGIEFNKRQKIIIQKLLENKELKLTTTIYAQLVYCGRDTALRDVTDLMKKQILSKEGGLGKNTRYKLIH
jgi:Fic family protein